MLCRGVLSHVYGLDRISRISFLVQPPANPATLKRRSQDLSRSLPSHTYVTGLQPWG